MTEPRRLADSFIHLGLGAAAVPQPPFDGIDWYEGYGTRHGKDGREGRLVSQHTFRENWPSWEMHPRGSEVVICTAGEMTLTQEYPDGHIENVTLNPGEYAINPPGVWHIADVDETATAIFITAGEGTQHRRR
ncbi:cupin domain-containing protein [Qipengyuania psychrotolerans]|uniref:Cupin domain-containing protein n=1 Tax=Qipengyuania psychrotolerans TaxID=2867238 RepID=A0ABX8ZCU9_9SPHN|nr:cupin domain-containing protein [Qipengyuania psychrotolerans]QZD86795.1 cupin domain-containing protein [Qipengyuania psychrotolerans]